ncbi:ABC transporter permease [Fimbriiglobus ruber]|uniref:Transport permease protein n=1 Tax=Fimbriiglobus ruber TaxID=1908690 RepID=A0A225E592_9BACT|nr:ABC transporter permease [Fimbriiglobus ruber]OWK43845.1 ABC-type multidrug transport system, permease component [Fimbriiglobus ruber]
MRAAFILFWQAALARTYPRVAWMFRNRTWLLQETLLPMLSVAAFAYVYEAMNAPRAYIGFVVLGAAMTTFWMNVLWSMGAHLYWERDSGNLELYVMSPAPMMGILAGMALGGATTTIVRALAIVATGVIIFDVPVNPSSWWLLSLVFGLTMIALYGLGMMFASVFLLFGREAWHTVNLLQEPVYLLTGMNFPVKVLGQMVHYALPGIALLIPLTAGMDAMRQVLFGAPGLLDVWPEIGLLAVLSVVFLFAARWCLVILERKARVEGTLSVKWQ